MTDTHPNPEQGLTFDLLHVHPLQGFSRFQDIPELHEGKAAELSIWKAKIKARSPLLRRAFP